jgi:hypothetical protein
LEPIGEPFVIEEDRVEEWLEQRRLLRGNIEP